MRSRRLALCTLNSSWPFFTLFVEARFDVHHTSIGKRDDGKLAGDVGKDGGGWQVNSSALPSALPPLTETDRACRPTPRSYRRFPPPEALSARPPRGSIPSCTRSGKPGRQGKRPVMKKHLLFIGSPRGPSKIQLSGGGRYVPSLQVGQLHGAVGRSAALRGHQRSGRRARMSKSPCRARAWPGRCIRL